MADWSVDLCFGFDFELSRSLSIVGLSLSIASTSGLRRSRSCQLIPYSSCAVVCSACSWMCKKQNGNVLLCGCSANTGLVL